MRKKVKNSLSWGVCLILAFVLWTILVMLVDVQAIGPQSSKVGLSTINEYFHELTGVHMSLYLLTDYLSVIPFCFIIVFAIIGIMQLLKRKSLFQVDHSLLTLGAFYVVVVILFALFEMFAVNYRPILINGILEASYPSSTTMLVMCVMPTAVFRLDLIIKNKKTRTVVSLLMISFTVFMVIARMISGVHWFSDIIGGALLSAGLVTLYNSVSNMGTK